MTQISSIVELAESIAAQHGIDSRTAAREVVTVHVDQIADDPEFWNADSATLTPAGVEVVTAAIAASYAQSLHGTDAQRLLDDIAAAAAAIETFQGKVSEYTDDRDELIRAALRTELRRADIAAAAGVKEARLYQIRDGRR